MKPTCLTIPALILIPMGALANDAALSYGGTPTMLGGHGSVSMQSELTRMKVGEKTVDVDCTFVFLNQGKACTVRVGFPDQDYGGDDIDAADPPKGRFTQFQSFVNRKPIPTTAIRGDKEGLVWHVKTVTFPAHARTTVRDHYTVPVGTGIEEIGNNKYGHACFASYILHTGSSWRGPIGRSEVVVTLDREGMEAPLTPAPVVGEEGFARPPARDWTEEHGRVYYQGPCAPAVEGKTLRFVRTNWKPAEKDDILLTFEMRRDEDLQ